MELPWELIRAVPGVYLNDDYEVVLVDGRALGPGNAADVRWTGSGWRFRLLGSRRVEWLGDLLHEVGHVVLGHVSKAEPSEPRPATLDSLVGAVLSGALTQEEAARRAGDELSAAVLRIVLQHEEEAEAWARRELERWRRILAGVLDTKENTNGEVVGKI